MRALDVIKNIDISLFDNFVMDSRKLKKGDVFLAINSGNNYIEEAIKKGAKVIYDDDQQDIKNSNTLKVEDTVSFIQKLAREKLEQMDIEVIGVTGSNGKTTVKEMLYSILSRIDNTEKSFGNFNNHIGLPFSVLNVKKDSKYAIFEMGMNHLGEIEKLANIIKPNVGIITNIGTAHIGLLKSKENIFKAKTEMLPYIKDKLIVNGDDKFLKNLNGIRVGFLVNNNLFAEKIVITEKGTTFWVVENSNKFEISLKQVGKHNAYNALLAIATARYYKISWSVIQNGLKNVELEKMRFQEIKKNNDVFINDAYNSSPESLEQSLYNFECLYSNFRKIIVLGDMLELGKREREFHENPAHQISKMNLCKVLLYGDRMKWLYKKLKSRKVRWFSDLNELKIALEQSESPKAVLIKGSRGMKLEKILE